MSTKEIRNIMNLYESTLSETDMEDAISDVEREGVVALDDIAADYDLDPNQLRARYEEYAVRKRNIEKSSPEAKAKRDQEAADAQRHTDFDAASAEVHSKVNPAHTTSVEDFLPTITTPSGFTREEGQGHMSDDGEVWGKGKSGYQQILTTDQAWVNFTSDNIKITVNVSFEDDAKYPKKTIPGGITVWGHTNFNTPTGWKTFSRRGIDDSFHFDHFQREKGALDINALVAKEIAKAEEGIARHTNNIVVPGLPGKFTIDPKNVQEITAKLQAGKTHNFMPGGMGTGYTLSVKPLHQRMGGFDPSPQGPKELADFFGVSKIYVTSIDAD